MKELNMKPEEIANLVVLSREKGYAIVIPQDSLYLVSKAFQKQLAHRDAQIAALDERLIRYAGIATARAEHVAEQEKQIAALTTDANALRADGVKQFANQQRRIAIEQEKFGDYEFSRHCSISADEADEFAVAIRERNDG
ncbi:hypothetical protein ACP3S8_09380 [Mixta calida]|uniref:hypothetical protein n=1 Tax=Mixta calida TaxID=665913 RepID=UPI003CF7FB4C